MPSASGVRTPPPECHANNQRAGTDRHADAAADRGADRDPDAHAEPDAGPMSHR
jgi:hypothetical protein